MSQEVSILIQCDRCDCRERVGFTIPASGMFDSITFMHRWQCRLCQGASGHMVSISSQEEGEDTVESDDGDGEVGYSDYDFDSGVDELDEIFDVLLESALPSAHSLPTDEEDERARGLRESEWKVLPCKTIESRTDGENCGVCFDSACGEKVVSLPCKHEFHRSCIIPWLRTNNSCPVCRSVVVKKTTRPST